MVISDSWHIAFINEAKVIDLVLMYFIHFLAVKTSVMEVNRTKPCPNICFSHSAGWGNVHWLELHKWEKGFPMDYFFFFWFSEIPVFKNNQGFTETPLLMQDEVYFLLLWSFSHHSILWLCFIRKKQRKLCWWGLDSFVWYWGFYNYLCRKPLFYLFWDKFLPSHQGWTGNCDYCEDIDMWPAKSEMQGTFTCNWFHLKHR